MNNMSNIATRDAITQSYIKHAALAQLHRWYLGYEEPQYGIANQLDILDEQVSLASGLGEAKGHEAYRQRVKQLPATWSNAHFVKSTKVDVAADGIVHLNAEITYINKGMLPDGVVRKAELSYTTALRRGATVLPLFTHIKIQQHSEGTTDAFTPAYAQNRLSGLMHYWLALIEDPARNAEPVREILAPEFTLNFTSGKLATFDQFKQWLKGPGSAVAASMHSISNFKHEATGENSYKLSADFDWTGITPTGDMLHAKTHHEWAVIDNKTERFARIKTMNVSALEPLAQL